MILRVCLFCLVIICVSTSGSAGACGLEMTLAFVKDDYRVGEPIVVRIAIQNRGESRRTLLDSGLDSNLAGRFSLEVRDDGRDVTLAKYGLTTKAPAVRIAMPAGSVVVRDFVLNRHIPASTAGWIEVEIGWIGRVIEDADDLARGKPVVCELKTRPAALFFTNEVADVGDEEVIQAFQESGPDVSMQAATLAIGDWALAHPTSGFFGYWGFYRVCSAARRAVRTGERGEAAVAIDTASQMDWSGLDDFQRQTLDWMVGSALIVSGRRQEGEERIVQANTASSLEVSVDTIDLLSLYLERGFRRLSSIERSEKLTVN